MLTLESFFQPTTNVGVVTAQPKTATVTNVVQGHSAEDQFYLLSVTMTLICLVIGGVWSLMCTIPALLLAISVS